MASVLNMMESGPDLAGGIEDVFVVPDHDRQVDQAGLPVVPHLEVGIGISGPRLVEPGS